MLLYHPDWISRYPLVYQATVNTDKTLKLIVELRPSQQTANVRTLSSAATESRDVDSHVSRKAASKVT